MISIIVAKAQNNIIGGNNKLLWHISDDLKRFKEGLKNKSSLIDCLICELQDSINCAYVDNEITEEQCDYLYRKYIRMEKEKND